MTFIAILSRPTLIKIPTNQISQNQLANQALSAAVFKLQKTLKLWRPASGEIGQLFGKLNNWNKGPTIKFATKQCATKTLPLSVQFYSVQFSSVGPFDSPWKRLEFE